MRSQYGSAAIVAVVIALHAAGISGFGLTGKVLNRRVGLQQRSSSELYSLNAKWISIAVEEESNKSAGSPKPPEKEIEEKNDEVVATTPSVKEETPNVGDTSLESKAAEISGDVASKPALPISAPKPPAPLPVTAAAETKEIVVPKTVPVNTDRDEATKPKSSSLPPSGSDNSWSPSAVVKPSREETFASRVSPSVANSPTGEPEGIRVKEVEVAKSEDTENKKQKEQMDTLRVQQSIAQSFLKFGNDLSGEEAPESAKKAEVTLSSSAPSTPLAAKTSTKPSSESISTKAPPAKSSGFFGFLNPSPGFSDPNIASAPTPTPRIVKEVKKVEETKTEKVMPAVAMKGVSVPVKEAKKSGGGLFGFLANDKQSTEPVEKVAPAVAMKNIRAPVKEEKIIEEKMVKPDEQKPGGFFGMFKQQDLIDEPTEKFQEFQSNRIEKVKPVVATKSVSVPVKVEKKSGGGLFGFRANEAPKVEPKVVSKPAIKSVPVVATVPAKSVAMNSRFLQSISKLLKADSSKIKSFQKSTDEYRAGSLNAADFLKKIEILFGIENLEAVIEPLCSELPEIERSKTLRLTYTNLQSKRKSAPSGGFFGFLAKSEKPEQVAAPKSVPAASKAVKVTTPVKVTPKPVQSSKPVPAPVVKKSLPLVIKPSGKPFIIISTGSGVKVQVPSAIPVRKQIVYAQRFQSFIGMSLDADSFYNFLLKELGQETAQSALGDIISKLPAERAKKLSDVARSAK